MRCGTSTSTRTSGTTTATIRYLGTTRLPQAEHLDRHNALTGLIVDPWQCGHVRMVSGAWIQQCGVADARPRKTMSGDHAHGSGFGLNESSALENVAPCGLHWDACIAKNFGL